MNTPADPGRAGQPGRPVVTGQVLLGAAAAAEAGGLSGRMLRVLADRGLVGSVRDPVTGRSWYSQAQMRMLGAMAGTPARAFPCLSRCLSGVRQDLAVRGFTVAEPPGCRQWSLSFITGPRVMSALGMLDTGALAWSYAPACGLGGEQAAAMAHALAGTGRPLAQVLDASGLSWDLDDAPGDPAEPCARIVVTHPVVPLRGRIRITPAGLQWRCHASPRPAGQPCPGPARRRSPPPCRSRDGRPLRRRPALRGDRVPVRDTRYQEGSVTAAMQTRYDDLDPDAARAGRLLPVHTGPDFTAGAAAALDTDPGTAGRLIAVLAGAGVLEETAPGRWRLRDLAGPHARDTEPGLAAAAERGAATGRVIEYYLRASAAADQGLLAAGPSPSMACASAACSMARPVRTALAPAATPAACWQAASPARGSLCP
jgi:hypothetical protein